MTRWRYAYETIQFSLKVLVLGLLFNAIGLTLLNPNLVTQFEITNEIVLLVANVLVYVGSFIINIFPILILIVALMGRTEKRSMVMTGLLNYFIIHIMSAVLYPVVSSISVSSNVFDQLFLFNLSSFGSSSTSTQPFVLGVVASILAIFITRSSTKQTQKFGGYGLFGFLGSDMWSLLLGIVESAVCGLMIAFGWPYVIQFFYGLFEIISSDIKNPMNLFIYGVLDRLSAMLSMSSIIRQEFWFGSLGGTWMDSFGTVYTGDINIWIAQYDLSILLEAGKFTAAYYVSNLFMIPGYLFALYRTYTEKRERRKNTLLYFVIALIVALSGNMLIVEIIFLLVSPFLYVIHLLLFGVVNSLISGFQLYIGISNVVTLQALNPGNLIDYIYYLSGSMTVDRMILITYLGLIMFAVCFLLTTFFYNKMALDILHIGVEKKKIEDMIEALGGIENIEAIHSTPIHIMVRLKNRSNLSIERIHRSGVIRVVESKYGYKMNYGSGSYLLAKRIRKEIKQFHLTENIEKI